MDNNKEYHKDTLLFWSIFYIEFKIYKTDKIML